VTDGQPDESPVVPKEYGFAQTLVLHGAYLRPHIQPRVESVRELTAAEEQAFPLVPRHFREAGPPKPAPGWFHRIGRDRLGQDQSEEPCPEAELLVKTDVLPAVGKGKQTSVLGTPSVKAVQDGFHQPLAHTSIPPVGVDG
jgi:hypothetical protein